MILRKIIVLSAVISALGAFAGGCQSGGVGDPCTPEDEYQPSFSGFAASEVNIESRSFQCETRVCLVNHFRGRVSCPLGQDATLAKKAQEYAAARQTDANATLSSSGITPEEEKLLCHIPGSSGKQAEVVQTSVSPQCNTRQANKAVYCSCRCGGSDPNARYCDCPSGFECTPFPELDLGAAVAKGSGNLSGSYCVKKDDLLTSEELVKKRLPSDAKVVRYTQGDCPPDGVADKCNKDTKNCGVSDNINLEN